MEVYTKCWDVSEGSNLIQRGADRVCGKLIAGDVISELSKAL